MRNPGNDRRAKASAGPSKSLSPCEESLTPLRFRGKQDDQSATTKRIVWPLAFVERYLARARLGSFSIWLVRAGRAECRQFCGSGERPIAGTRYVAVSLLYTGHAAPW